MIVEPILKNEYQKIEDVRIVLHVVIQNGLKVQKNDGVYSEESSKRFDCSVDFLRGFSGVYSFEVVLFDSDGSCNEVISVYSVSGMCTRFSCG